MEANSVVRKRYSPNPNNQMNYTVFCGDYSFRTIVTAMPPKVPSPALRGASMPHLPAPVRRPVPMLAYSRHRLRLRRLVELRKPGSDLYGCRKGASMETLADVILGMLGMSDWEDAWLSEEQVKYACVDAFLAGQEAYCLGVG